MKISEVIAHLEAWAPLAKANGDHVQTLEIEVHGLEPKFNLHASPCSFLQ